MTNVLSETAQLAMNTFQNDTIVLLNEEPLYAYLLVDTRIVMTRQIDVAAVSMENGDFVFYLNPEGYLSYTQGERLFIIKHEWTHWIDEHPLQARFYAHSDLWNLACDIAINQDLETDICHLPKDAQMPNHYDFEPNRSPEQYYAELVERRASDTLTISDTLTDIAKGHNSSNRSQENNSDRTIRGYITKKKRLANGVMLIRIHHHMVIFESEKQFYDMEGKNTTFDTLNEQSFVEAVTLFSEGALVGVLLRLTKPDKNEEQSNSSNSSSKNEIETIPSKKPDLSPGKTSDNNIPSDAESKKDSKKVKEDILENMHPNWGDLNEQSPQMVKHHLEDMLQKTALTMGSDLPAKLSERIKRSNENSLSFKNNLRFFVAKQRGQRKEYTYRKKNKRNPNVPGVKKTARLRLVLIIDTSFSINKSQLALFDSTLRSILKTNRDAHLVVMTCDTEVRDIFLYDRRKMREDLVFEGRGGTDFRPAFDMIEKRTHKLLKIRPDGILYLTDGAGIAPDHFSTPTLWCLTPNGHKPFAESFHSGQHINWGHVIHLPD